ncbi:fasciclin-1 [Trichonephila clavipes]|nr:fasciclin-1 [Trichonephila clavipes]
MSTAEYYVNNAKILRSEDYVSQDGTKQLLYVIDEILQPYVSSTSLPPTALDLLDKPELYDIREPLSAFDFRVKQEGLQELFMREGNNTFFLPVGAGVGHSFNRQQEVDKWVSPGHISSSYVMPSWVPYNDRFAFGDESEFDLIHHQKMRALDYDE